MEQDSYHPLKGQARTQFPLPISCQHAPAFKLGKSGKISDFKLHPDKEGIDAHTRHDVLAECCLAMTSTSMHPLAGKVAMADSGQHANIYNVEATEFIYFLPSLC